MIYEVLFPFLKGFHLTLAKHLPQRNSEGWKMTDAEWIGHLEGKMEKGDLCQEQLTLLKESSPASPDKFVTSVPRFYSCLKALD